MECGVGFCCCRCWVLVSVWSGLVEEGDELVLLWSGLSVLLLWKMGVGCSGIRCGVAVLCRE